MARPLRIQYAGALYHVMARGNQGRAIFHDTKDRVCFLKTLGDACEKTAWRVHAYVLMGMGHYTRVTQAVSRATRKPGRKLQALKQKLIKLEETK